MDTPTPLNMPGADAGLSAVQAVGGVMAPAAAEPAAAPAAPAPTPPAEPAATAPSADAAPKPPWGDGDFDPDMAWRLVTNLREELANYKHGAEPILAAHEEQRRAAQSELERTREDLANATAQLDVARNAAVQSRAEALAAGRFVDTETALTLIGDLSAYMTPTGIDDARLSARFEQLAADKPFLVAGTDTGPRGFAPNRGQSQSGTGPITPAQTAAHAMSQGDYKAAVRAKAQQLVDIPRF